MAPSNFKGVRGIERRVGIARVPLIPNIIIILLIIVIANENEWLTPGVEGRTWPRIAELKSDCHHKSKIYPSRESKAVLEKDYNISSSALPSGGAEVVTVVPVPKSEINSSLSPILPSPLHLAKDEDGGSSSSVVSVDYQDLNGKENSRCNHHHYYLASGNSSSNNKSNNNNEDDNGDDGKWTFNSTNCLAGPFHLGTDVNESVYKALCPFSSSGAATNGKFPIQGLHCRGEESDWFTECSQDKQQGINGVTFTLNKCDDRKSHFDTGLGECVEKRASESSSSSSSYAAQTTSCPMSHEEISSDEAILHWVLLQIMTPVPTPEESRVSSVTKDLQSLEDGHDENGHLRNNDNNDPDGTTTGQLETICKLSSISVSNNHGLHPHPHLCTKYLQCSGDGKGTYFLKTCGPGTVFNPELLICDWPANVAQCDNALSNGNALLRRRRTTGETDSEFKTAERNRCNFTGIRPDPQFCNKYRLCSAGGQESVHSCGLATLFNPLSGVCDFADEVDCKSRRSDLATYGCDKGDEFHAPHPDYCNKFLECEDTTLVVKSCPPGTLYDREGEKCDHAFKVTCRKPISLEHDIDVNWKTHGHGHEFQHDQNDENTDVVGVIKRKRRSSPTPILSSGRRRRSIGNTNKNKLNLACEYNYIAPHPHSCHRFVECEQGRIFIKTCGPGTAFNGLIGKCDWPKNVREPDTLDCTRYRQCSLRHGYQIRSCPQGQYFDQETRNCVRGSPYQIQQCSRTPLPPPAYTERPFPPDA